MKKERIEILVHPKDMKVLKAAASDSKIEVKDFIAELAECKAAEIRYQTIAN